MHRPRPTSNRILHRSLYYILDFESLLDPKRLYTDLHRKQLEAWSHARRTLMGSKMQSRQPIVTAVKRRKSRVFSVVTAIPKPFHHLVW